MRPANRIFHVDGDSFFASCEIALNPKLEEQPVWVGGGRRGDGIVIAANRIAKKYGISTGMACFEAKRLCLRGVLCKPHYDEYRRLSLAMFKILEEYAPVIVPMSIDEGFLDLSTMKEHMWRDTTPTAYMRDIGQPGELRRGEVSVGRHMAPASKNLGEFLKRYADFYGPRVSTEPRSLVAAAAAHHRLAWIHPFLDGNGRVARLFTLAWFIKAGADSDGLWTISRGLARRKAEYQVALANADEKRMNDFDGRGYLSHRHLGEFCQFFLSTAADQVEFMQELLGLEGMLNRIVGYGERREFAKELPGGSALVLREIFLRGEIARGDVPRIIAASPRTAQKVTGELLAQRLVSSGSPKGPLRLGFPSDAAGHYFPNLYPAGAD